MHANVPRSPQAEINITPLVDVMLVLLVIFMLATPMVAGRTDIDLPQVGRDPPPPEPATLTVGIGADGTLFLDGTVVEAAVLDASLADLARRAPETLVTVDADRRAPYGDVAPWVAAARRHGLQRVGFRMERAKG